MINQAELPLENVGYKITDRIQVGQNDYVIGEDLNNEVSPYVTWAVNYEGTGFVFGHYFETKEEATLDLFKRAGRGIALPEKGASLAKQMLTEEERMKIYIEEKKESTKLVAQDWIEDYFENQEYDPSILKQHPQLVNIGVEILENMSTYDLQQDFNELLEIEAEREGIQLEPKEHEPIETIMQNAQEKREQQQRTSSSLKEEHII